MITDIIGQKISIDDFVVFYSNIYQVIELGKPNKDGSGYVKIKMWNPLEFSRPVRKYSKDIAVLPKNAVLMWMLKQSN